MATVPEQVLVTGAYGQIGTAVLEVLRVNGIKAFALTDIQPGDDEGPAVRRIFVGDAGSARLARAAVSEVDAVIHLAAIRTPLDDPAIDVFTRNTRATFAILDEAGKAGVRRAVIASSYSILGLTFAAKSLHPAYFPIDVDTPSQIEDPYGLSKEVDEATARMMHRRYGMDIVALRLPYVCTEPVIAERLRATIADPGMAATESWSYLDVRDAAQAVFRALIAQTTGARPIFVAAPQILAPYPTEDLIRRYHPDSEIRRPIPGRETPIDLGPSAELLGFQARHVASIDQEPLP